MANESEYRRMQRLVEMRHALVGAIDRKAALNQVVRADGQKIAFRREQIGSECRRRHFDHDADLERARTAAPRASISCRASARTLRASRSSSMPDTNGNITRRSPCAAARTSARSCDRKKLAAFQREADRPEPETAARHLVSAAQSVSRRCSPLAS